jgi:hypothetical protein
MRQEISSANNKVRLERDEGFNICNLTLSSWREVEVRKMKDSNICVAGRQDGHLGLAEYITHD